MIKLFTFLLGIIIFCNCNFTDNKIVNKPEQSEAKIISDSILQTGFYYVKRDSEFLKRQLDKDSVCFFIDPTPIVTAKNITSLEIKQNIYGSIILVIKFDDNGTEAWSEATRKWVGRQIAFVLDDKLLEVPIVNSQITGGVAALNRGIYSREELEKIKTTIENENH
jgi:preprotein translocase subunit SecD